VFLQVNAVAGNEAASTGNGIPSIGSPKAKSAKSPLILSTAETHSQPKPVLSSPPVPRTNKPDAQNATESGEMAGVQKEATASVERVPMRSSQYESQRWSMKKTLMAV
jgi:hypothetical protein